MLNSILTKTSLRVPTKGPSPKLPLSDIPNPSEPTTTERTTVVDRACMVHPTNIQLSSFSNKREISRSSSPSLSEYEVVPPAHTNVTSDLTDSVVSRHPIIPQSERLRSRSSSPFLSEFEETIHTSFIPDFSLDLLRSPPSYSPNNHPHGSINPQTSPSSSRSSSPLSSDFEDLVPSIPSLIHDFAPNPRDLNTTNHGSSNAFGGVSVVNRRQTELESLDNPFPAQHLSALIPPSRSSSPSLSELEELASSDCISDFDFDLTTHPSSTHSPTRTGTPVIASIPSSPQSATNLPLSTDSPALAHLPPSPPPPSPSPPPFLMRHEPILPPQFILDFAFDLLPYSLTYASAPSHGEQSDNLAELVYRPTRVACPATIHHPRPRHYGSGLSPGPSRLTIDTLTNRVNDNGSPLASPITTPSSSPPAIPPPTPDMSRIIGPPQQLPWEGPSPHGLTPRNRVVYQRAGVHWMLKQIFGSDVVVD